MFTLEALPTATNDIKEIQGVTVFPNPVQDVIQLEGLPMQNAVNFTLYDVLGRVVLKKRGFHVYNLSVERGDLQGGIYLYRLEDDAGRVKSGKLLLK
jgi:hypothetical protein